MTVIGLATLAGLRAAWLLLLLGSAALVPRPPRPDAVPLPQLQAVLQVLLLALLLLASAVATPPLLHPCALHLLLLPALAVLSSQRLRPCVALLLHLALHAVLHAASPSS
jgi:hypothetical protein